VPEIANYLILKEKELEVDKFIKEKLDNVKENLLTP
jgi:hypothetical protein